MPFSATNFVTTKTISLISPFVCAVFVEILISYMIHVHMHFKFSLLPKCFTWTEVALMMFTNGMTAFVHLRLVFMAWILFCILNNEAVECRWIFLPQFSHWCGSIFFLFCYFHECEFGPRGCEIRTMMFKWFIACHRTCINAMLPLYARMRHGDLNCLTRFIAQNINW